LKKTTTTDVFIHTVAVREAVLFCHFHSWSGSQRLEGTSYSFAYGRNCFRKNLLCKFNIFQPIKNHLEGGNYFVDKLLFSNCLYGCNLDFKWIHFRTTRWGPVVYRSGSR